MSGDWFTRDAYLQGMASHPRDLVPVWVLVHGEAKLAYVNKRPDGTALFYRSHPAACGQVFLTETITHVTPAIAPPFKFESPRARCEAIRYSDEMQCARCGLAWDVNDPDRPECRP